LRLYISQAWKFPPQSRMAAAALWLVVPELKQSSSGSLTKGQCLREGLGILIASFLSSHAAIIRPRLSSQEPLL